jgi:hypothetical protein
LQGGKSLLTQKVITKPNKKKTKLNKQKTNNKIYNNLCDIGKKRWICSKALKLEKRDNYSAPTIRVRIIKAKLYFWSLTCILGLNQVSHVLKVSS